MFMLNAFCWLGDVISYMDLNCPGIGCSLVAMVRYMWQMVYSQRFTRTNLGSRTLIRSVWHDIRWYPQSICGLEPMVLVRSIRNFGIMEVFGLWAKMWYLDIFFFYNYAEPWVTKYILLIHRQFVAKLN